MKVSTLLKLLEGVDENAEVMIAYQPNWPLAAEVANVVPNDERQDREDDHHGDGTMVWIVAGDAPYDDPYAPRDLFESW